MPYPLAIPAAGKIAGMIGIKGFIAIGLGLALAIVMWRADVISGQRDKARAAVYAEQAAHGVTKASLLALEKTLADYIADGERRKKAAREALEDREAESASLERQIARLRSAGLETAPRPEECPTPGVVRGLEGL